MALARVLTHLAPMNFCRSLLDVLLSLTLLLGSVAEAGTRSEIAAASDIVLCGSTAPVTPNATGQPQTPRHPCHHCLAGHAIAVLPQAAAPTAPIRLIAAPARPTIIAGRSLPLPQRHQPRGPPTLPV